MHVRCSLELHFVGGSSKRIGYFDWSQWLSALELELRQLAVLIGTKSVHRTEYFAEACFGNRVFEGLGSRTDACGYLIL